MFKKEVLGTTHLEPTGFKILVEMLARIPEITVSDVPMVMRKRIHNETKANFKQGIRYIKHVLRLVRTTPHEGHIIPRIVTGCDNVIIFLKSDLSPFFRTVHTQISYYFEYIYKKLSYSKNYRKLLIKTFIGLKQHGKIIIFSTLLFWCVTLLYRLTDSLFDRLLLTFSLVLTAQGIFALYLMVYAWEHPDRINKDSSPKTFTPPQISFTAVVPAVNEAEVIGDTIRAVANIDYPAHLVETLVVLRDTDTDTISAAERAISKLNTNVSNVRIHIISGPPINKPHHLNSALAVAKNDVVCIFDAEDEPHHELYSMINTVMLRDNVDVIQSGVQLMNFESNWYSIFNVLEYFLWFRSSLHFFAQQEVIPLGGNTVFFKREWLMKVQGWDMNGLTEDADIGLRLSQAGARIRVVYDPVHVTQEETPPSMGSFIKQRTRWSQGFLQILFKGEWINFLKNFELRKTFFTLYILSWPLVHGIMFILIPFSIFIAFTNKVHPLISIITNLPILVLTGFIIILNVSLYEFTVLYHKKWSVLLMLKTIFWFFPYQFLLGLSSLRAVIRMLSRQTSWEKTAHINAHRAVQHPMYEIAPSASQK
ncbi:MAG: glycosyltransferase [Candidatus Paceibacterota bacterium]